MKNLGLKFLAVFITLLLFAFVNSQSNQTELSISVPVKFKNLPDNKFILLPVNRQIQVTVRGPTHKISSAASGLFFEVVLPSNIENKLQVTLNSNNLNLPHGLEAYSINPSKLDLILDDVVTKAVRVEILTIGQVNSSTKLIGISSEPSKVEIKGPASEINQIDMVETLPIDLREVQESGDITLDLRTPSTSIILGKDQVKVSYDLADLTIEKKFAGLPLEVRAEGDVFLRPDPNLVDVELSGPSNILKQLQPSEVAPFIRINKRNNTNLSANVRIDLPEGVALIKVEPAIVNLVPIKK